MKNLNPELDRYVIEAIVESIECGKPYITFGDLAEIISNKRGKRLNASGSRFALERIQEYCNELGLPALSAMVVKEKTKLPGDSFFSTYREILLKEAELPNELIVEKQRQACLTCKDWQKLLDYVSNE